MLPHKHSRVENYRSRLRDVWKNVQHFHRFQNTGLFEELPDQLRLSVRVCTFCAIVHVCAELDKSRECSSWHQQHFSDAFFSSSFFHSTSTTFIIAHNVIISLSRFFSPYIKALCWYYSKVMIFLCTKVLYALNAHPMYFMALHLLLLCGKCTCCFVQC